MFFSKSSPSLGLAALAALAPFVAAQNSFGLWGYGDGGISAPIFYADGLAYVGFVKPEHSSTAVNITFVESTNNVKIWEVTENLETTLEPVDWPSTNLPVFYAPIDGDLEQAGFVPSSSKVPAGAGVSGWTFYGTEVVWLPTSSGNVQAKFWAQNTNQSGLYKLVWNTNNEARKDVTPLVVKRTLS